MAIANAMASPESRVRGAVFLALAALTLGLLAASLSPSWRAIAQGRNANADQPARIAVNVPQAPATLVLSVKAFRQPPSRQIGGIVRIKRPGATQAVEVGRFSIFPAGSFEAGSAAEERRYRFEVARAARELGVAGGEAEVEVQLYDRAGGQTPAGTELVVGSAQVLPR